MVTTCCVGAEVPQTMINNKNRGHRKVFFEMVRHFKEDYYIELQRHAIDDLETPGWSTEPLTRITKIFLKSIK